MVKVLIADDLNPRAKEIFEARGIEVDQRTDLSPDELAHAIGDCDALAIRSSTQVTAELLATAPRLKVVGRAGIGVDNIDVAAATQRGVVVMNTPFGNTITTAEHAVAMIFALARDLPAADRSTRAGRWEKSRFMGIEVSGKVLGIVGCGNIGSIVAERARGLKMRVIASDPYLSTERAESIGVEKVEFDTLLATADFITLHTPLSSATRHMIDAAALAKMKPEARLINCARGGLIDEAALHQALTTGGIAGAALDVFETEPARESPLFALDNVVATPHLGASTNEAQVNVAVHVAKQIADFLLTGAVVNALNMASVSAEEAPGLRPYMRLAEQLGSFAGQMTETGLRGVRVEYAGAVAELNTRPLTAIVLQGLLTPLLDTVNMVSAPLIARERNIDVVEIRHQRATDFQTLIRLTVITDRQERSVAGTLFGGDKPRVVEVAGIPFEAELGAHMLFLRNHDKPGLIGALGTALGDAGVNIATFHLGRAEEGGSAMALIEIDEPLADDVLEAVRGLEHVITAKRLAF